jgi:hypothetical protein
VRRSSLLSCPSATATITGIVRDPQAAVIPGVAVTAINLATQQKTAYAYGSWTRTVTPSLLNDFRMTHSNRVNHAYSPGHGGNWASRFGLKGVSDLPLGKGKSYLTGHWLGYLVGHWPLGGLVTMQSGESFTVNTQVNNTFVFSAGGQRANVLRDPNLPNNEKSLSRWFDTTAFLQPSQFMFGNQGVNILRADGLINLDMSVLRNFPVGEGKKVQFRGEFFNLTNHPNFGGPGATLNGPGFGIVSSASPGRRIQIGARFVF